MAALGLTLRIRKFTAKIAAVVETGLAMWHQFTADSWDGSTARLPDSSTNGNRAALFTGRGLEFDGVNDYVDVGDADVTCNSIVFYVNPDSTTESILQLTAAISVSISSGTLTATGWTSPTLYVNGVAGSTVAAGSWQQIAITSATGFTVDDLEFGRIASVYFDGGLSNIKIFSEELTAGQVAELYANPEQALPTGASSGDLVGWWQLAETGGSLIFNAAFGIGGINSGGTRIASIASPANQIAFGSSNKIMYADGVDDSVNFGNVLDVTTIGFSCVGWLVTGTSLNNKALWVKKYSETSASAGYGFFFFTSSLQFRASDGTTQVTLSHAVSQAQIYHFAATFNSAGNANFYLNGSAATPVDVSTLGSLSTAWSMMFYRQNNGGTPRFCDGAILSAGFLDTVLSSAEVAALYAGGSDFDLSSNSGAYVSSANLQGWWKNTGATDADWQDNSSNSIDGTVAGSPATVTLGDGRGQGKNLFGGTPQNANTGELILHGSGYALATDAATLDITTNLTLEAWVKPFSVSAAQTIIGKNTAYALGITAGAKPVFTKWTSSASTATATTSTTLTANVWTHLAATYDGTNVRLYLNGTLDTTTAVSGAIDSTATDVLLGALTSSTENFDGYIDSVKVYDEVKTGDEILENYNAEKASHQNS